jgi:hypothetical protein
VINPGSGPVPPASGALFGLWIKKQNGQKLPEAITGFEHAIGRRSDIVQNYYPWTEPFPSDLEPATLAAGGTPLISWNGTDTSAVTSGGEDAMITERARAVAALHQPVFLRWFWEMDNNKKRDMAGSPEAYIAAWKHIRTIFREQGATNAAFVWCPTSIGFSTGRAQPYYPGDDQVDWVCADGYSLAPGTRSFAQVFDSFYSWAAPHRKPIILAEFGVKGNDDESAAWLRDGFGSLQSRFPAIKAVVYFDSEIYSLSDRPRSEAVLGELVHQPYFNPRRAPDVP